MPAYDTSAQWLAQNGRRRLGLIGTVLTVLLGSYFLFVYVEKGARGYAFSGTLPLALAFLFFAFAIIPLSLAFAKREHPVRIETSPTTLRLVFKGGRVVERKWEEGPIDMALDSRKAGSSWKRHPGLEITLWMPIAGIDPQVAAFRPQELVVSGPAFDEIMSRMESAGYSSTDVRRSKRHGVLVHFAKEPTSDADE